MREWAGSQWLVLGPEQVGLHSQQLQTVLWNQLQEVVRNMLGFSMLPNCIASSYELIT